MNLDTACGNFGSKKEQKCETAGGRNFIVFDEKYKNINIDYDDPSSEDLKFEWPDNEWYFSTKYRVTASFGKSYPIPFPETVTQFSIWLELNNKPIPGSGVSTTLTLYAGPVTVNGSILMSAAKGDKLRLCWSAKANEVTTVYQKPTGKIPEIYSAHLHVIVMAVT